METATPTQLDPKVCERLAAVSRDRFNGGILVLPGGTALSTDGVVTAVCGATMAKAARQLRDAKWVACAGRTPVHTIHPTRIADVVKHEMANERGVAVAVSMRTQPDAELRESALVRLDAVVGKCEERLRESERDLKALAGAGALGVGEARHKVADAKAALRRAVRDVKRENSPMCRGIKVGAAHMDLHQVRRALRALGCAKGTLHAAGPLSAVLLRTNKGEALVMPVRPAEGASACAK
jgi:hypothetical protein